MPPGQNVGASVFSARAPVEAVAVRVMAAGEERLVPVEDGWAVAVEWDVAADNREDAIRFVAWVLASD